MNRGNNIQRIDIDELMLDSNNPRFGGNIGTQEYQKSILATIVDKHGISDLLTSMSSNGYFDAEPVVAVDQKDGNYTVVEGNRRLVAALVLTKSDRASDYHDIADKWLLMAEPDKIDSLKQFPVAVFEERNAELIAYIGIKHIRGSKPWDSYAKANWLFELISESNLELSIEAASRLIGDQNSNTVKRVIEAYVMMNQLKAENNYNPQFSTVKGRGSNPDYPFSWVYTAIGYENIRNWIEIDSLNSIDQINSGTKVLNTKKALNNGEKLVDFLFGSRHKSIRPVVKESREIRLLNEVVTNKEAVKDLESGDLVQDVQERLRPVDERLFDLFYKNKRDLETINTLIASERASITDSQYLVDIGRKSMNILQTILNTLSDRITNPT